jgi:hypothetical protein
VIDVSFEATELVLLRRDKASLRGEILMDDGPTGHAAVRLSMALPFTSPRLRHIC